MDNNNDKAKRILFGNKNLPDNPEAKMNEEALDRKIEFIPITDAAYNGEKLSHITMDENLQWAEPSTIGNPSTDWDEIKRMASENKPLIPQTKDGAEIIYDPNASLKLGDIAPIEPKIPINWHEEHARFDQINKVLDYCNEIGVSPEQLIEDHKAMKRQNKEWQEECARLAKIVEYWQSECYKLNPGFQRPKLDHL